MDAEEILIEEVIGAIGASPRWFAMKPATLEPFGRMMECDAAGGVGRVRLLLDRAIATDRAIEKVRDGLATESDRRNVHNHARVEWARKVAIYHAMSPLLRRKLPLGSDDLIGFATWLAEADCLSEWGHPVKWFVKTLETRAAKEPLDEALGAALLRLCDHLRTKSHHSDVEGVADRLERLVRPSAPVDHAVGEGPDPAIPGPAGTPGVLVQLKQILGLLPRDSVPVESVGFDHFPLRGDQLLRDEHTMLTELFPEVVEKLSCSEPDLNESAPGRRILALDRTGRGRLLLALAERNVAAVRGRHGLDDHRSWQSQEAAANLLHRFLQESESGLDRNGEVDVLLLISSIAGNRKVVDVARLDALIEAVSQGALTAGERHVLYRLRARLIESPPFGQPSERVQGLTRLLGDRPLLLLVPGEPWADAVNADLAAQGERAPWLALLKLATTASGTKPTEKWLKSADKAIVAVGQEALAAALVSWFPLVTRPRSIPLLCEFWDGSLDVNGKLNDENADCLRGLAWMAARLPSPAMARALGTLALGAYRKIRGAGPRAVKVGNAAVYALGEVAGPEAVGQLAVLKVKVKSRPALKEIEKAFDQVAAAAGLPRADIEELSVPTYGLEEVGQARESFGDVTAEVHVAGTDVALVWTSAEGKVLKSVPAAVKKQHGDDVKELLGAVQDLATILPAQRDRIDGLAIANRSWRLGEWRQRYLDHPLVGTIARRLIWTVDGTAALAPDGVLRDLTGQPLGAEDSAVVALWHPVSRLAEELAAWRARLAALQITQPFKQAHRELYLLTSAERDTAVYSNRFAAHILRQSSFHALCAARGWTSKLRMMNSDVQFLPATKALPAFGLRAELWIEHVFGEANAMGTYLHIGTDQVRFYPETAPSNLSTSPTPGDPVALADVPPLAFSEVMRDVDLFVSVASIGNDATWQDGGPGVEHRPYWLNYSFGDLTETARTRRRVLEALVPRLKIASVCSVTDRFLVVRGKVRTYKIHLGSGNILMEPDDQHLCIVPSRGPDITAGLFLPFEGDTSLALILSKAVLLAADDRIQDPTIVSQIRRAN